MTRESRLLRLVAITLALSLPSGCTTYMGIIKSGDNVYLTGLSSFWVFSSSWVKRCREKRSKLICQELDVREGIVTQYKSSGVSGNNSNNAPGSSPHSSTAQMLKHEACKNRQECINFGKCTESLNRCIVGYKEDCMQSKVCKSHGSCTAMNGICVVGTDSDCQQSEVCIKARKCRAINWRCVE